MNHNHTLFYRNLILPLALFVLTITQVNGQIGNLGKKLREKAADAVKDKLVEKTDEKRDSYDTTSFNYAIAFLDKSESFADREKGEGLVKTANFLLKEETGKTAEEEARDLYEVGRLTYNNRRYLAAGAYLKSAEVAFTLIGQERNPVYLKTLGMIGLLNNDLGLYNESENYIRKSLSGWENTLGQQSGGYASQLNNLAVLHMNMARFNDSENNLKQAMTLIRNVEGPNSVPYAIALNNMGILHQYMGRSEAALEEIGACLEIAEEKLRDKSSTYLQLLTNKALVLQENGKYELAEETYNEAIDLQLNRLKVNRSSDPDYAHMLNNLASLYAITDRRKEAENLLKESLDIHINQFGENNIKTADAQLDLGNLLRIVGKNEEAKTLVVSARTTFSNLYGPTHPRTIEALESEAILDWLSGDFDLALAKLDEVMKNTMGFINEFFPPMSESEKTKYWEKYKSRFYLYYNFAFSQNQDELIEKSLNYRLATKGLLLNSTTKIKNSILNGDDEELKTLYEEWQQQKNLLAVYYTLSKEEISDQNINIDSLERESNETEAKLSAASAEFSEAFLAGNINYKELSATLEEQSAVVEVIKYPKFDKEFTTEENYAFAIIRDTGVPEIVHAENGNQLDTRYFAYYNNVIRKQLDDQFSYDQYWKRLESKLQGINTIYFSPDGIYSQLNPNTFKDSNGEYLISKLDIRYIGNPVDLFEKKPKSSEKKAFLLGFPSYTSPKIPPLPGTRTEIEKVSQTLSSNYLVESKLENDANETNLKSVNSPAILHIATHGFFLEDTEGQGKVFGVEVEYARNNPLLRAGLMLAGAEGSDSTSSFSESDDGVLTAYEAVNLDLSNTELVVLSACETGKGDVKAGEGVYGLQRAFQVAGTRNLLMSLWKVDDEATQKLMTKFYANWSESGKPELAFRKAQLSLMEEYQDPYYWGAFVMLNR